MCTKEGLRSTINFEIAPKISFADSPIKSDEKVSTISIVLFKALFEINIGFNVEFHPTGKNSPNDFGNNLWYKLIQIFLLFHTFLWLN